MIIFLKINDENLRQKILAKLQEKRREQLVTSFIHNAKTIICDEIDRQCFVAHCVKRVVIINPSKEQIEQLKKVKKTYPWIKTNIKYTKTG